LAAASEGNVRTQSLKVGDVVRVKSRDEILATLDERASVRGMPFMPEMLAFAGQEMTVDAVVNRTCDTINDTGTTRGMSGTVHLSGSRCDGSAHGGCQARCLLYWREEWLTTDDRQEEAAAVEAVPEVLEAATRTDAPGDDDPTYRCQATEVLEASCFASPYQPQYWIHDIRSGNARLTDALMDVSVVGFNKVQSKLPQRLKIHQGASWPWYDPTGEKARYEPLNLQPGDLVEVRSLGEIEATLDARGTVRGLRFSAEMMPYCGKRARVLAVLDKIIDEETGRMIPLRDCIVLEDVWCEGKYRLLCRRKIYLYWRETWLKRP
jgi:hypothetical protein